MPWSLNLKPTANSQKLPYLIPPMTATPSTVSKPPSPTAMPSRGSPRALRQRAGVALLTGLLAWGCGLLGPDEGLDVNASFTGTHDAGVCRFVFRAKATQPEQTVFYTYQLRAISLIAPETYAALVPLEEDVGSFRDSLMLTWDVSLGTEPQIGRLLRFRFTAGIFQLEDEITVTCRS